MITGASSGIGLATARMAAARGAESSSTSRNEDDLRCRGINRAAVRHVVADVAVPAGSTASPTRRSANSAGSIPGSTTPACRSTAS